MGIHERRRRDFERRETELLEAALGMLDHDRWLAVTIDQIAEAAEIGKGTIYKHFTSKDELYARLALAFQRRLLGEVAAVDFNGDAEASIRRACEVVVRAQLEPSPYHRVVEYCHRGDFRRLLPETLRAAFDGAEEELVGTLTRLVQQGQAGGRWTQLPARDHALAIVAVLAGSTALARIRACRGLGREGCAALAVEGALAVLERRPGSGHGRTLAAAGAEG